MTVMIPRFEKKTKEVPYELKIENKRTVLIKDHKTDNYIVVVNFGKSQEVNSELADIIIGAIEEYVNSD